MSTQSLRLYAILEAKIIFVYLIYILFYIYYENVASIKTVSVSAC